MKILSTCLDERSSCLSVLTTMTLEEYIAISKKAFDNNGNIEGQRGVIKKSTSAIRIRKRMEEDFEKGAIFPQVVLGLIMNEEERQQLNCTDNECYTILLLHKDDISIIDGMQRSNIYFKNYEKNKNREIRVELWIAQTSTLLLYRMLVLNTGQTPWNTRRQIETIYSNLAKNFTNTLSQRYPELSSKVEILSIDETKQRRRAGQFHKDAIIESYLGFNTRSVKVNLSDEIAEEYQRFDVLESIEKKNNYDYFVDILALLFELDITFSKMLITQEGNGQFKRGQDIFSSDPACMGFVVACSEFVLGKINSERTIQKQNLKMSKLQEQITLIRNTFNSKNDKNIDFLALSTLNDVCSGLPKSRIGDEMRTMFKNAFSEMIKYDDIEELETLGEFWKA